MPQSAGLPIVTIWPAVRSIPQARQTIWPHSHATRITHLESQRFSTILSDGPLQAMTIQTTFTLAHERNYYLVVDDQCNVSNHRGYSWRTLAPPSSLVHYLPQW